MTWRFRQAATDQNRHWKNSEAMRCKPSAQRRPVQGCTFCRCRHWSERVTWSSTPACRLEAHIHCGSQNVPASACRNDSAERVSQSGGSPGNTCSKLSNWDWNWEWSCPCDYAGAYMTRDALRPSFPWTILVLWVWKSSVSMSCEIRFDTSNVPWFSRHKNTNFLSMHTNILTAHDESKCLWVYDSHQLATDRKA